VSKINIRQMTLTSLFAALTAVGGFISIPLYPVPLTLQTLFTLLAAMILGSVMGASSQIIYVLLGVIGLPVFAGFKAGIGILFGPTGGFLLGFIISAYIIGKIVELKKEKNIFLLFSGRYNRNYNFIYYRHNPTIFGHRDRNKKSDNSRYAAFFTRRYFKNTCRLFYSA